MYEIADAPKFVAIAAGGEHTLLVSEQGALFVCGRSENGRLGLLTNEITLPTGSMLGTDVVIPTEVPMPTIRTIGAGEYHSAIVQAEEPFKLFTFGCGAVGQLGHGSSVDDVLEPREVEYFTKLNVPIDSVALGDGHTFALLHDNSIHAFGNNESGALGLTGSMTSGFSKQSERYGFGVRGPSRAVASQVLPLAQQRVVSVATGTRHSMFLTQSGDVFVSGDNQCGHLGLVGLPKSTIPRRVPLDVKAFGAACGAQHSLILIEDGSVRGCGSNKNGELGLSQTERVDAFVPLPLTEVAAVAAGAAHSLFLLKNGDVLGCGWGACGALGIGRLDDAHDPIRVLGSETYGRAVAISCSSHHSLILLESGVVLTAGCNGHGQLGVGSIEAKQLCWKPIMRCARVMLEQRDARVEVSVHRQRELSTMALHEEEFNPRYRQESTSKDGSSGESQDSFACFQSPSHAHV